MSTPRISVRRNGPVAYVALDRPAVRNAMDEQALAEITSAFRALSKDASVRAAVISGNGPDFCAGADIAWMRRAADFGPVKAKADAERLIEMCRSVDEAPFAVIARVHGNCFGGALGIVGAADVVVAAEGTRMRFSEVRLGILPAVVSTFVLPKIGMSQARRLYLTAEVFDAQEAWRIGLVHKVVPPAGLDAAVDDTIKLVLQNGPKAVREAKAYARELESLPRAKRLTRSKAVLARVRSTPEAKEGLSAFLDRRDPNWVK